VFEGRVVSQRDPGLTPREALGSGNPREFRFQVTRMWRGSPADTLRVWSATTDCGYPFRIGRAYVVYAWRRAGVLRTGACDRTRPAARATADLRDLRRLGSPRRRAAQESRAADLLHARAMRAEPVLQRTLLLALFHLDTQREKVYRMMERLWTSERGDLRVAGLVGLARADTDTARSVHRLAVALSDTSASVRIFALHALRDFGPRANPAVGPLTHLACAEPDTTRQAEILAIYRGLGDRDSAGLLTGLECLGQRSASGSVRAAAEEMLRRLHER